MGAGKKHSILIIADIAQAHDGSLGILHSYIDAVSETGVDIIKFQTHIAEAESSVHEPFRVPFSYVDRTRFDYWKRMEFTTDQWKEIKTHCEGVNLEFMSTPFSNAAVDLLQDLGVERYKIGSGDVTNLLLLEKVAKTGKEIILSSGMNSFQELDRSLALLKEYGNRVALLQCTTMYPAPVERIGLNVITEMRQRYRVPVGLSDHSGHIYPSIAAAALGAEIIEIHAVFDKRLFGPDSAASLTVSDIKHLVEGIRVVEETLNHPVDKTETKEFEAVKAMFEKTLAVNKDLPKGVVIEFEDLEAKKPSGLGIPASQYRQVIGRQVGNAKSRYDFLEEEDLI